MLDGVVEGPGMLATDSADLSDEFVDVAAVKDVAVACFKIVLISLHNITAGCLGYKM
jgi:hypothetical protein